MKTVKIMMLFLLIVGGYMQVSASKSLENDHSSLVIVKIENLDKKMFEKITAEMAKHASMSLEYSCLESDVMVVKLNHDFTAKADVQHYINNQFKKWSSAKTIEFIYIDLQTTGISKC